MQLFDWLYPRYLPLFTKAIEYWYNEPFVTTPILKLMAELVQNRSQRLTFEISSPNGILLFREASQLVCTYGSRVLTLNVMNGNSVPSILGSNKSSDMNKEQIYPMKLKGIFLIEVLFNKLIQFLHSYKEYPFVFQFLNGVYRAAMLTLAYFNSTMTQLSMTPLKCLSSSCFPLKKTTC